MKGSRVKDTSENCLIARRVLVAATIECDSVMSVIREHITTLGTAPATPQPHRHPTEGEGRRYPMQSNIDINQVATHPLGCEVGRDLW